MGATDRGARKLGITAGAVSRWATGEPIPPWLAEYLRVMQELDRLHRLYVQPPKRERAATPAPDVGAPKVTGRVARMAKRVNALKDGRLFAAGDAGTPKIST